MYEGKGKFFCVLTKLTPYGVKATPLGLRGALWYSSLIMDGAVWTFEGPVGYDAANDTFYRTRPGSNFYWAHAQPRPV